jgi:hypothetical protein
VQLAAIRNRLARVARLAQPQTPEMPERLMDDVNTRDMNRQNAPYFRMWQDRYKPFCDNWYLYMEFSPGYFEKLKRELESAGYEVTAFLPLETIDRQINHWCWHSPPVGDFGVNPLLKGESFVFFAM